MDPLLTADRPRELVTLLQRSGLVVLPMWVALVIAGVIALSGAVPDGDAGLGALPYIAALVVWWPLKRLYRRWYGDVKPTDAQRLRGLLLGVALVVAFVLAAIFGPDVAVAPVPAVFALWFVSVAFWEPWRVSMHWLFPAVVFLWLSVLHVTGPQALVHPGTYSVVAGLSGGLASLVDHILMVRAFRRSGSAPALAVHHA